MSNQAILFVDDDTSVLRAMQRLFRKLDADIFTAASGTEGLAILADHPIQVIVSDQRMPEMPGTDFLKEVRIRYPDTVRCILSGYAEMHVVVAAINDGNVFRFIPKPWDDEELKEIVSECLEFAASRISDKQALKSLQDRANALESESAHYAELVNLQELVLNSARDVLEHLPIAVAAVDGRGTMTYANRRFVCEFGHVPGTMLGQPAGEPWQSAGSASEDGTIRTMVVDDVTHRAHIACMDIGGQPHTLIAMPIEHFEVDGAVT